MTVHEYPVCRIFIRTPALSDRITLYATSYVDYATQAAHLTPASRHAITAHNAFLPHFLETSLRARLCHACADNGDVSTRSTVATTITSLTPSAPPPLTLPSVVAVCAADMT